MVSSSRSSQSLDLPRLAAFIAALSLLPGTLSAQEPATPADVPIADGPPREFGPGPGFGPGRGPVSEERKIVKDFDQNGDKRLNKEERAAAREFLKKNPLPRRGPGGRGPGGGGFGRPGGGPPGAGPEETAVEPKSGVRVSAADVKPARGRDLYAPNVLRTFFFDFETEDWETELSDFHGTDVEVPAVLTVDGAKYPGVGIHFRGMSSYMMVRAGQKRSLNVSIDLTEKKQRLEGYKTLNLLNSHGDSSMMSCVLYSHIARQYIAAPKANFVRVVINGESWGIYVNAQQFNKDFVQENFRENKGARWKVSGSPGAQGGLDYIGEEIAEYKKHYDLKDGDDDDWRALISLCKTLSQTPPDQLEAALEPILDLESTLWFLALDCALINSDGYWVRASDYSIYRDNGGKFHIIPSDMNEAFRSPGGGPGMRRFAGPRPGEPTPEKSGETQPVAASAPPAAGGEGIAPGAGSPPPEAGRDRPRGGFGMNMPRVEGVKLDPLHGMDDAKKPLRSKLLAAPRLKTQYLENVRTIADEWLDWKNLGPVVAQYRSLIEKEVEADTRKLSSFAAFQRSTASDLPASLGSENEGNDRRRELSLRKFADDRRAYLLSHPEIVQVSAAPAAETKISGE